MTEQEAVIRRVLDAWAANDADSFVSPYAEDATATLPGSYLADRAAIRRTMEAAFAGPLKGTTCDNETVQVRGVGADAAVVNSRSRIVPGPPQWSRETWTLVRRDGGWLVAAYQASPEVASGT
jgi:uncharacterized protein (TIGR02246 family)